MGHGLKLAVKWTACRHRLSQETKLAMVAAREIGRPPLVVGGTEGLLIGGAVAVDELGES